MINHLIVHLILHTLYRVPMSDGVISEVIISSERSSSIAAQRGVALS